MNFRYLLTCVLAGWGLATGLYGQSYDFDALDRLLQDSSSLYLDRIYVEVFNDETSIYKYQSGWINCDGPRLGQGSATKWISSAVMLKLAEEGWWNLDDSIGTYLPVFSQYGKGHITLRQSYSMSSGMFNPGTGNDYHKDPSLTLDQSVDSIARNVPILYPTGGMIGYDGTMMHVWGKAAEVVDARRGGNRDWRTIAKEEFFDALGMNATDYTDFLPNPAVAGGIETTPCDYLRFLNMIARNGVFEGDTILQSSSVDEMFTDQTHSAPVFYSYWPDNHPDFPDGLDTIRYTFGAWWSEVDRDGNILGITSPGAYGHYPFVDRCRNLYGTFFCYIRPVDGGFANVMDTYLRFMSLLRDGVGSCSTVSGVEESKGDRLHGDVGVFPNPSDGTVTVQSEAVMQRVEVYTGTGRKMMTIAPEERFAELNLDVLGSGGYFIRVQLQDGRVVVQPVLVK